LVIVVDVVGELHGLGAIVATSDRFVESLVVTVRDDVQVNISGANVLSVHARGSSGSLLFVVEENGSETVLSSFVVETKDDGSLDVLEVSEEV
jgi:hypothetical protein